MKRWYFSLDKKLRYALHGGCIGAIIVFAVIVYFWQANEVASGFFTFLFFNCLDL